MGSCLQCGGTIPDGASFCDSHKFDPGKVLRVETEPDSGPQDPPGGGGSSGAANDAPRPNTDPGFHGSDPPSGGVGSS